MPGVEPGMSPSQGEVLTTILHTPGEAGYRSQYLSHAMRALYHLSSIPFENHTPPHFRSHACSIHWVNKTLSPPLPLLLLLALSILTPAPPVCGLWDAFCALEQLLQSSSLSPYPPYIQYPFIHHNTFSYSQTPPLHHLTHVNAVWPQLRDMTTHNGQVVSFDSFWQIRVVWGHNEENRKIEREIGENEEEERVIKE